MTDHPITPPPELMRHWSRFQGDTHPEALWFRIANEAAQWGSDQELEACCEWLKSEGHEYEHKALFAARRPSLQSLKEKALKEMDKLDAMWSHYLDDNALSTIRRALEALPDD